MTSARDPRTRIVLSWLREETHENAERVLLRALDEVDTTPQRRSWWPAWRDFRMNKLALTLATAATVLVVAVVGYNLLPRLGIVGPGAAPSLLARGTFVTPTRGAVDLEATGEGSSVTGRMTWSEGGSDAAFTVDLQCARTTEDGLIMIGGVTTDTAGGGSGLSPVATWAGIVLRRGSPVEATVWSQSGGPASRAATCLAYLDEELKEAPSRNPVGDGIYLEPIDGTVEFGP